MSLVPSNTPADKDNHVEYKKEPIRLDVWICIIPCFPLHIIYK